MLNEDYALITKTSGHSDLVHAGELRGNDGNGIIWTIGKIVPGRYNLRLQLQLSNGGPVTSLPVFVEVR